MAQIQGIVSSFVPEILPKAGVLANPGMTSPLAQGGKAVGAAVAGAGADVGDFYARHAAVVDDASMMKLQNAQHDTFEAFQAKAADPADPQFKDITKWHSDWEDFSSKQLAATQSSLPPMSPAAAIRAQQITSDWQAQTGVQIKNQVVQQQVLSARTTLDTRVAQLVKEGDTMTASYLVDQGVRTRLLNAGEGEARKVQIPIQAGQYAIQQQITQYPGVVADSIRNEPSYHPELPPDVRQQMLAEASRQTAYARVANENELRVGLLSDDPISRQAALEKGSRLIDEKVFTAADLKMMQSTDTKYDPVGAASLGMDIAHFDPKSFKSEPEAWQAWTKLQSRTMDPSMDAKGSGYDKMLEARMPIPPKEEKQPVADTPQAALRRMRDQDITDGVLVEPKALKLAQASDDKGSWREKLDPKARNAEEDTIARIDDGMNQFWATAKMDDPEITEKATKRYHELITAPIINRNRSKFEPPAP